MIFITMFHLTSQYKFNLRQNISAEKWSNACYLEIFEDKINLLEDKLLAPSPDPGKSPDPAVTIPPFIRVTVPPSTTSKRILRTILWNPLYAGDTQYIGLAPKRVLYDLGTARPTWVSDQVQFDWTRESILDPPKPPSSWLSTIGLGSGGSLLKNVVKLSKNPGLGGNSSGLHQPSAPAIDEPDLSRQASDPGAKAYMRQVSK